MGIIWLQKTFKLWDESILDGKLLGTSYFVMAYCPSHLRSNSKLPISPKWFTKILSNCLFIKLSLNGIPIDLQAFGIKRTLATHKLNLFTLEAHNL
jgi:hypothetical protein